MIKAENLKKLYGRVTAVDGITFEVSEGEILGFLGPNGAGKSSTMRMVTGYSPPTSGTAIVAGFDITKDSLKARQHIGYLPENTPLYHEMNVLSYLGFTAQVKGVSPGDRASHIRHVMEETGIDHVANRTVGKLSKGYRQRVGLAQALIGDPKILILDEPTVGLDPNQIREIRDLIKNMAGKRTVILSTHILPEVSMVCERVMIIHEGKLVASDAVGALSKQVATKRNIRIELKAPSAEVNGVLEDLDGIQSIECIELASAEGVCQVKLAIDAEKELRPDIVNRVVGKGWSLYEIRSDEPTLEDIFVEIISGKKENQDA